MHLALMGPVRLRWHGQTVGRLSHPCRALLACIALSPTLTASRDQLAALIWGDLDESRAKRNLRHALFQLRAAVPQAALDALVVDPGTIGFSEATVCVDALDLMAKIEAGTVPSRSELAAVGHMLSGLGQPRESLAIWQRAQQRDFLERVQLGLHALIDQGSDADVDTVAGALLQLDPSDEVAARHMITQAHIRGDTGKALRIYRDLWDHLDAEFDTEPSETTQNLIVEIKSGAKPAAQRTTAPLLPARSGRQSVRVAPLNEAESRQDHSVAAQTLRAEIIARLARFRELRVLDGIAANTVDVAYQLDPIWRTGPNGASLVVTLKRSFDGAVILSYISDPPTEDLGRLPSTVAASVATACGVEISRARLAELLGGAPRRDAVDEWLLGQNFVHQLDRLEWEEAERCFRRAQTLDPGFSKALSSLAQIRNVRHLVSPGEAPDMAGLREGTQLAAAAIRADPLDGQAYLAQAWAACLQRRYGHAEAAFSQALRLCPDDPWVVLSSALGAAFSGRAEDAARGIARYEAEGWTMTPLFWTYRANIRFLAGDLVGCVADVEATDGGPINLPGWAASALALQGETRAAADAWDAFEARAQARSDAPLSRQALLDWFLSSFPLRRASDQTRLATGAKRAVVALTGLRDTA